MTETVPVPESSAPVRQSAVERRILERGVRERRIEQDKPQMLIALGAVAFAAPAV